MLQRLFGCSHLRTTFPMRPPPRDVVRPSGAGSGDYVVCLDCGREFAYDWKAMRLENPVVKSLLRLSRPFRQMTKPAGQFRSVRDLP